MSPAKPVIDKRRFGPWAVVTGSSSGIGAAFARHLAANGLNVVLVARRIELLVQLARELNATYGVETRSVGVDLTTEGFMDPIRAATDDLDIGLLISNAGAPLPGEFLRTNLDRIEQTSRLDVTAPLRLVHHFGARLVERGRGGVILVSAMGARQGLPLVSATAAGRSFILSLGEGLHVEFAERGVGLTVLITGPTQTAVLDTMGLDPSRMPLKPASPDSTAAEALTALASNRPTHLSGRMNRIAYRLLPTAISTRMARSLVAQGLATLEARAER